MMVQMIISGGQTGADQAGLAAAITLGLKTGGWVPKGYRTEKGAMPVLKKLGLREHWSSAYPPRTELNVRESDGTLLFGRSSSPGSKLTMRLAEKHNKPLYLIRWTGGRVSSKDEAGFRQWLIDNEIAILNVAGNREEKNPGITTAVHDFLVEILNE